MEETDQYPSTIYELEEAVSRLCESESLDLSAELIGDLGEEDIKWLGQVLGVQNPARGLFWSLRILTQFAVVRDLTALGYLRTIGNLQHCRATWLCLDVIGQESLKRVMVEGKLDTQANKKSLEDIQRTIDGLKRMRDAADQEDGNHILSALGQTLNEDYPDLIESLEVGMKASHVIYRMLDHFSSEQEHSYPPRIRRALLALSVLLTPLMPDRRPRAKFIFDLFDACGIRFGRPDTPDPANSLRVQIVNWEKAYPDLMV